MIRHIPNILTLPNLFCGALAVISVLFLHVEEALVLQAISLIADFLDGLIARKLNVAGPLGVQLDSLADVISFGIFPGAVVYMLLVQSWDIDPGMSDLESRLLLYPAFLLPVFGALRLARFNISTDQGDKFIGMPIPSMSIFFAGLLMIQLNGDIRMIEFIENKWFLYGSILLFAYLMNSPWIHFKIKPDKKTFSNPFILLLAGAIIGLIIFYPFLAPTIGIVLYSTFSIISHLLKLS